MGDKDTGQGHSDVGRVYVPEWRMRVPSVGPLWGRREHGKGAEILVNWSFHCFVNDQLTLFPTPVPPLRGPYVQKRTEIELRVWERAGGRDGDLGRASRLRCQGVVSPHSQVLQRRKVTDTTAQYLQ
jgi:hypothetical protein